MRIPSWEEDLAAQEAAYLICWDMQVAGTDVEPFSLVDWREYGEKARVVARVISREPSKVILYGTRKDCLADLGRCLSYSYNPHPRCSEHTSCTDGFLITQIKRLK